ncbi:MAG: hypothetical protein AAF570_00300, partial [Bacteroidota bacterium]
MNNKKSTLNTEQSRTPSQFVEVNPSPEGRTLAPPPFQLKVSEESGVDSEYEMLMEAAQVAGPGFADPDEGGSGLNGSDGPVQMMKSDAQTYITNHSLGIAATKTEVERYIYDTTKPTTRRSSLLAAWNQGQSARWRIDPPADLAPATHHAADTMLVSGAMDVDSEEYDSDEDFESSMDGASISGSEVSAGDSEEEKSSIESDFEHGDVEMTSAASSASADHGGSHPYPKLLEEYRSYYIGKPSHEVESRFGTVKISPSPYTAGRDIYISSKAENYDRKVVKSDYLDIIKKLKRHGPDEEEIARILLTADSEQISKEEVRRAAAMIVSIVYVAEEWRKHGAGKIFRGALRAIRAGKRTFSNFKEMFKYMDTADAGRQQVGRIIDAKTSDKTIDDPFEKDVYDHLSEGELDDYISDDETMKKKDQS